MKSIEPFVFLGPFMVLWKDSRGGKRDAYLERRWRWLAVTLYVKNSSWTGVIVNTTRISKRRRR